MTEEKQGQTSIIPRKIVDEMRGSYLDYAMSVIIGRALPDVRDGLKPVHRRILFAMHEQSNTWNRAYKKSARIVGDVIGKYHPHGDQSVYDALVRMAQDFSMRLLLVDGQGNFGSIDGDPPAAMRYTEVRMTRACGDLLADLEKETVDFGPNYDGSEHEPLVMPTRIPNLLVNGSEGIAVGMATRIPPHNLGEVVSACIELIDRPEATVADLMQFVTGPDFPTGGLILGIDGIREAYETGRGVIRIRGRAHIETDERTGRETIVVTELPFQVNKARLLERISELVRDKENPLTGISDLRDESDRTGMRMVVEVRRDANGQVVLNQLYKRTSLETSFGINALAIVAGQPRVLGLRDILSHFIDFRRDVVTRRCVFELRKARERMHILEALKKALDMIDEVIRTIRASSDADEAREGLKVLLEIDDIQAQAILDMRLQRLTNLEINKLLEEMGELQKQIDRLNLILSSQAELLRVIRAEFEEIRSAYRDPRRTEVLPFTGELSIEDLIANEDEVVTLSHAGYVKRTPIAEYRTQKRGGKGSKAVGTRDEDFVEDVWVTTTHSTLLVFTSTGRVYPLRVHEVPAGGRTSRGKPIINLIPIQQDEKVMAVLPIDTIGRKIDDDRCILTATRDGHVKKTELRAYRNIHAGGLIGVRVPEGDELVTVRLCEPDDRVLLASRKGQSIVFMEAAVRATGRDTQGVRGIRLGNGDTLVAMLIIPAAEADAAGLVKRGAADEADEGTEEVVEIVETGEVEGEQADEGALGDSNDGSTLRVLTITENGYGKRTRLSLYSCQGRGGKGVITIKTSARNGMVASVRLVGSDDQVLIITDGGTAIRSPVTGISESGRNTLGVRLMNLDKGEKVVGVAQFTLREEDEAEGETEAVDAEGEASGEQTTADATATETSGAEE
jgi:DNA gyrase subunit A